MRKMKVHGFNIGYGNSGFVLSKSVTRVWADEVCGASKWGFFIRPVIGEWMRPIGKIWKLGWWLRKPEYNAWTSGNHWFVLRSHMPFPGLLFSLFFKTRYFYAGTKTLGMDWPEYNVWTDEGDIDIGHTALAPSLSLRGF